MAPPIQRKATVSSPEDAYEREADEVAEEVLRMPDSALSGSTPTATHPRMAAAPGADPAPQPLMAASRTAERGGSPLPTDVRGFFEDRFGHDFSRVRVHSGAAASASSSALGAEAYTLGPNIVFNDGRFAPGSASGQRLIAHELTHVIQQGAVSPRSSAAPTLPGGSVTSIGAPTIQYAQAKRSLLLSAMDRLHALHLLTNADYLKEWQDLTARTDDMVDTTAYPRTEASLRTPSNSIEKEVARDFLFLPLSDNVGKGMPNQKADVLALQVRLHALHFLTDAEFTSEQAAVNAVTGPLQPTDFEQTLQALGALKHQLATGGLGWQPIHTGTWVPDPANPSANTFKADELRFGVDKFAALTFQVTLGLDSSLPGDGGADKKAWVKNRPLDVSVFVPPQVALDTSGSLSKVHVFYSANETTGDSGMNAALIHGMRGAAETSQWIVIGLPGLDGNVANPGGGLTHVDGWVVITPDQITDLLKRVGRPDYGTLRLSSHSRGAQGLRETLERKLFAGKSIEKITVFDEATAFDPKGKKGDIGPYVAGSGANAPPPAVDYFQVVAGHLDGANSVLPAPPPGTTWEDCMRAIGYSRLIQDADGTIGKLRFRDKVVPLLTLPPRGQISSKNVFDICKGSNVKVIMAMSQAAIQWQKLEETVWILLQAEKVKRREARLSDLTLAPDLVNSKMWESPKAYIDLHNLHRMNGIQSPTIDAHHFFVAEFAHELFR
jgi:Domain of unknown function (DUF4157)